ncbi:hypothetical protein TL16_g11278, partial [Triparma laevis f. inornata]|uniref:Uncharacterized protein n=2 Tax=Triparma laevis TaxID=1534972 RepID=A0A9W7FH21_9STRA
MSLSSTRRSSPRTKAAVKSKPVPSIVKKEEEQLKTAPARVSPCGLVDSTPQFLERGENESYDDFVARKRKRNHDHMVALGLADAANNIKAAVSSEKKRKAVQRGATKAARAKSEPVEKRRSGRLSGVEVQPGFYVDRESNGKFTVAGTVTAEAEGNGNYDGRVNDGDDIDFGEFYYDYSSEEEDVDKEHSRKAKKQTSAILERVLESEPKASATTAADLSSHLGSLRVDSELQVAKVTPERIYSMAMCPVDSKIIIASGDKHGNIGFWDTSIDSTSDDCVNAGVVQSKPHSGVVTHLEFNRSGSKMLSVSYDCTVRELDLQTQKYSQVFATYGNEDEEVCDKFKDRHGYGVDQGVGFFTQYGCYDKRSDDCVFLTTSKGTVIHYDRRVGVTFHEPLCTRKLNSLSQHPTDSNIFAVGGLAREVKLFDLRKFNKNSEKRALGKTVRKPTTTQIYGGSINSTFFSPSGSQLLTTCMKDCLTLTSFADLKKGGDDVDVGQVVAHNNQTGRYLSVFMSRWHPSLDLFTVGCMKQPRQIEIFGEANKNGRFEKKAAIKGDYITAVCSRNVFHPTLKAVAGGNSSGRVTVAR